MASFVLHCHFVSIPHSSPFPCTVPLSPVLRLRCCLAPKILPLPTVLQNANNGSAVATPAAASASCGIKLQTKTVDWQHTHQKHTHTHTHTEHTCTHSCGNKMRHRGQSQLSDMRVAAIEKFSWLSIALEKWKWNGKWKYYAAALPCHAKPCPTTLLPCWHPHWQFICHTECIRKIPKNLLTFCLSFSLYEYVFIKFTFIEFASNCHDLLRRQTNITYFRNFHSVNISCPHCFWYTMGWCTFVQHCHTHKEFSFGNSILLLPCLFE